MYVPSSAPSPYNDQIWNFEIWNFEIFVRHFFNKKFLWEWMFLKCKWHPKSIFWQKTPLNWQFPALLCPINVKGEKQNSKSPHPHTNAYLILYLNALISHQNFDLNVKNRTRSFICYITASLANNARQVSCTQIIRPNKFVVMIAIGQYNAVWMICRNKEYYPLERALYFLARERKALQNVTCKHRDIYRKTIL